MTTAPQMLEDETDCPAVGSPVDRRVGRPAPERCKDCGLTLPPWLRLYCTKCVQPHLGG